MSPFWRVVYGPTRTMSFGLGLCLIGLIALSRTQPVRGIGFTLTLCVVCIYVCGVALLLSVAAHEANEHHLKMKRAEAMARSMNIENNKLRSELEGLRARLERGESNGGYRTNGGTPTTVQRTPRGLHVPIVHLSD